MKETINQTLLDYGVGQLCEDASRLSGRMNAG